MALNPTRADALAQAIVSALGLTADQQTAALPHWKTITEQIYAALLADITVTLPVGTVITVGSAATQTGPATPVILVVS